MDGSRSQMVLKLDGQARRIITAIGRSRSPAEACGLLLIDPASPDQRIIELANRSKRPRTSYEFISDDVIIAMENNGVDWQTYRGELAIWHTHPGGSIGPSTEDKKQKPEGVPCLVMALLDDGSTIEEWF